MIRATAFSVFAALTAFALAVPAHGDEIRNTTAVFAGLDKITGRVVTFAVQIDETVQFGTLQITPRACYSKPTTEAPQTVSFAQVGELTDAAKVKRIFSGWMFAASPGLNGIEHPVYDIWLLDCKGGTQTVPDVAEASPQNSPAALPAAQSTKPAAYEFSPAKAAAAIDGAPDAPAPSRLGSSGRGQSGSAPNLGAPIAIGSTPTDDVDERTLAPPGPLSPELAPRPSRRPTRKSHPATDDDSSSPVSLDGGY